MTEGRRRTARLRRESKKGYLDHPRLAFHSLPAARWVFLQGLRFPHFHHDIVSQNNPSRIIGEMDCPTGSAVPVSESGLVPFFGTFYLISAQPTMIFSM